MPLALADLAPLLYAVITLLLAAAIVTFGKFLAALVPSVPFIGSAIKDGITSGTEAAGRFLVGLSHTGWVAARSLITDAVWLDKYITAGMVSVLSHLGDQVSHVWDNLNSEAASLQSNIDHLQQDVLPAAVAAALATAESDVTHTATSLQHNIDTVVSVTLPNAVSAAKTAVEGELHQDAVNLQHNIDNLSADVTSLLASVWAAIDPLQTAVSSTLPTEIANNAQAAAAANAATAAEAKAELVSATQALEGNLNAVQAALEATISANATAAAALAAADLSTAEGQAAADAASAQAAATSAAAAALQSKATQLQGAIDANTQQIDTLSATETIALPALPDTTIPGTITVPVAVGALAGAVAGIISEVDNCMITACDGPHSLSNELSKLDSLFTITGELGFLAAAVKDPVGTEQAIKGVLGGIYSAGHDALDALLSI